MRYYDFGTNRLEIRGTVFQDPEKEVMLFHHNYSGTASLVVLTVAQNTNAWANIASWSRDAENYLLFNTTAAHSLSAGDSVAVRLTTNTSVDRTHRIRSVTSTSVTLDNSTSWTTPTIVGQFTRRACFNYGREITANSRTRTSRGTGIYFTGNSPTNWNPIQAAISVTSNGYLYARGGVINLSRPASSQGNVDIKDLTLVNSATAAALNPLEFREFNKGFVRNLNLVGWDVGNYNTLDIPEFTLLNSTLIETLGYYYTVTLYNIDTAANIASVDIGASANQIYSHRYYKLYNSVMGSSIRAMWRNTTGNNTQYIALESYKNVKPTVVDTNNTVLSSTKIYLQDTPSTAARIGYVPSGVTQFANGFVKITNTTPPVATMYNHGLSNNQIIAIYGFTSVGGIPYADPVNGRRKVTVIDADTFTLHKPDGTDVVGQQTFDLTAISEGITAITNNGGRIQLTVSSDWTANLIANISNNSSGDRVYIKGVVGGANLEAALNNTLHGIYAVTATTITLWTGWPSTLNTYTGNGTFHKVYKDSYNTTTTYDYRPTRTYTGTTNLSGTINPMDILISTQVHEYSTTEAAALTAYGGPYDMDFNSIGGWNWKHKGTNTAPVYSDWDTTRFGGFYKVDRRGVGNTASDIFQFKFCHYNKALTSYSPSLVGANTLTFSWVMFNDDSITQTNKAIVDAYTTIDTSEKFYDRAKSYLYDNYAGQTSTLVTRSGNVVNLGSYNVVIDTLAASAFAFDGSTFTLKADNFIGTLQTTGTLTLLNGAYNTDPRYIALTLDGASIAIYDNIGDLRYYSNTDQNITLPLSSTGLWTYKYAKHAHKLGQGSFTVAGGVINISPISIPDVFVLETSVETVTSYSTFDTTQKIYDYLSYYRTTSSGLDYGDLNLYSSTLDVGSNNIILFDSASPAFSYDGSTFTLNSLNLSGAAITTTGTISLSGNSSISDITLTTDVLDQTPADLTNVTINGILAYNTDSPASITYTDTTVDTVVNNGTGTVLIQRVNSSINNATDPEIDDYAPTVINITPNGGSVAIYDDNDVRQYFITTNSSVVLPFDATGTWSYKVAKYGYHLIEQQFTIDSVNGATINIVPNYIPDTFINELEANVANYTDLNTANEIHDYLMYFQTLSTGIDYGDLESESFGTITFTGSVALSSDATQMVSLSGSTLVLKSTNITDDIIFVSPGDITQHAGNTISDGVKLRTASLDSEVYMNLVDSLTLFPSELLRDNNDLTNSIYLASPTIYRFKYGSVVNGVTLSNFLYARVSTGGSVLLIKSPISIGTNTIDFGTTGNLTTIINNLKVVNDGVKKSSILIPHTTNI
jgi:hypothetical protein